MVDILHFQGLRFNSDKIKDFSKVLAPPYDIISSNQKDELKSLSPYNIINLTLPDKTIAKNRYENAQEILSKWLSDGIMGFDSDRCLYVFEESFMENNSVKSFTGFIGLLKVEEYGEGKVLRHEKTLTKPKEDRLNLLNACRTNFEFIYTIYNDDNGNISSFLNPEKEKSAAIDTEVKYDPALKFKLWKISNSPIISQILDLMKTKTLLIADGHHRYETSRLYRESLMIKNQTVQKYTTAEKYHNTCFTPEDYVMALFVSANQKDISIHPTHRVVKFNKNINTNDMLAKLSGYFDIKEIKGTGTEIETEINKKMSEASSSNIKNFCICYENRRCFFAALKYDLGRIYKKLGNYKEPFIREFEYLDVNILHNLVLSSLLDEYAVEEIKFVHTVRDVLDNFKNTLHPSDSNAGFILNAPDIKTVENLSIKGLIMPQKSTYFYPKPCSGLVMYKFDM